MTEVTPQKRAPKWPYVLAAVSVLFVGGTLLAFGTAVFRDQQHVEQQAEPSGGMDAILAHITPAIQEACAREYPGDRHGNAECAVHLASAALALEQEERDQTAQKMADEIATTGSTEADADADYAACKQQVGGDTRKITRCMLIREGKASAAARVDASH